jgi:general secretion pathway protein A
MYCNYYGFREKPFNITPNPRFLYLSKNHKEAFAHLLYGINSHAGFIELTGEVGTGKTTVLRTLLEQLDDDSHRTAIILNPSISALELLRNINREFGIAHEGLENGALLEELNRFLLHENRAGKTIVLVIDEAQNLAPGVLEQIRLISNLETESDKLIQILLAGQPELHSLLARPELRQLAQRITVRYHLLPMDFEDSSNYIRHRLHIAGGGAWINFSTAAMKRIFRFAKGSPRLINKACDRALLIGYTEDTGEISGEIAAHAVKELQGLEGQHSWQPRTVAATGIALLIAAAALSGGFRLAGKTASLSTASPAVTTGNYGHESDQDITPELWTRLPKSPYPAMKILFNLWGAPAISENGKARTIAAIASRNGFSSLPLSSLNDLILFDTPAIVEIRRKKGEDARFVAISAAGDGIFSLMSENLGAQTVSRNRLAADWTGRGAIIWENRLGIPERIDKRSSSADIRKLQALLVKGGWLQSVPDGLFGKATEAALQHLQREAGLPADGSADAKTMLLLNRSYAVPPAPRLNMANGKKS